MAKKREYRKKMDGIKSIGNLQRSLIVATAKQESDTIPTKDKLMQGYKEVLTLW